VQPRLVRTGSAQGGIAAPCSLRVLQAYNHDISRRPAPSKVDLAERLDELVRTKVALWSELLRIIPDTVLERAATLCDVEPTRAAMRRCRTARGQADAGDTLAANLAIAPATTELARHLVADLEDPSATRARWLCAAAVRLRADVVRMNLRLVFAVARKFISMHVQYEDMVADGNIGLFKSVDRFDTKYGVLFSTYAVHWIRHEIARGIDDRGRTVRIPVCARLARKEIRKQRELAASRGEVLDDEALAAACGVHATRIRQIDRDTSPVLRLDVFYDDRDDPGRPRDELADLRDSPEATMLKAEDVARLRSVLPRVSNRRAFVLRHRFGIDGADVLTLAEIGQRLGVSRERVRQHQVNGLQDLRELLEHGRVLGPQPRRERPMAEP